MKGIYNKDAFKADNIIRNFNLYILSNLELEEPYFSIYNDLERLLDNLNSYEITKKDYNDVVAYGHSKEDIKFLNDMKYQEIFIDYPSVWNIFDTVKYKMMYAEISKLLSWYLKYKYNIVGKYMYLTNQG